MKLWCSLLVLVLVLSSGVWAEALKPSQLAQLTSNPERLQGSFSQHKYLQVFDTSLRSSGRFDYQRSGKILWLTETPLQSELIMTRDSIINRQAEQQLIRVETDQQPAAKLMSDIFFALIASDWSLLERYFSTQAKLQQGGWIARLSPIQPEIKAVIDAVELSGEQYLERVVLHEANGDRTTIEFSDLKASTLEH